MDAYQRVVAQLGTARVIASSPQSCAIGVASFNKRLARLDKRGGQSGDYLRVTEGREGCQH